MLTPIDPWCGWCVRYTGHVRNPTWPVLKNGSPWEALTVGILRSVCGYSLVRLLQSTLGLADLPAPFLGEQ